ncbi:23S rRNA (adenine(2503)-C(2))-methyltransferase RlmN [Candidatus Ichthyocystis hellenicum]|uniref:23S rRNA (adenine(2503)-C(2))-methyltransferase RlmN n=1 Tax=Candidatus Ichthyocystis hellenicum TaxID=1561003 RepID=UPI000B1A0316|nr:23S rRNA (adenine(2503)-C(2))-methyltransferase RlmN [Candidatus Ichthyocystis hellenicum]
MVNLFDFDRDGLSLFLKEKGYPSYRSNQLFSWVHKRLVSDFSSMSDISRDLRREFSEIFSYSFPTIISESHSRDGTSKWLLSVGDKNAIEMVYIPDNNRSTLCVSSQVGCALNCSFCATGKSGFNRNLTAGEIVVQLWLANRYLKDLNSDTERKITNVVFMGMGEPLANFDAVMQAVGIMLDDFSYGLSRRRVTVSTSGIVPAIDRMAKVRPVALAVSLHAPDDELRNYLVPINKKYPLSQLMAACDRYICHSPRKFITFEYVMLRDVNDTIAHAERLIRLLKNIPCKINLIPWNSFPGVPFCCSTQDALSSFQNHLNGAGLVSTIRKTRGDDIDAACGQLAGKVDDRTRRILRFRKSH